MSLEGISAGKGSATSLALCRNAEVYRKDVPNDTFLFELLCTSSPLTLLGQFPACREEAVNLAKVLGNGMLQIVPQCNECVAWRSVDTPLTSVSGVATLQRLSHSFGCAREVTYDIFVVTLRDTVFIKAKFVWVHNIQRCMFHNGDLWHVGMAEI